MLLLLQNSKKFSDFNKFADVLVQLEELKGQYVDDVEVLSEYEVLKIFLQD
jgi:hypothetical protein